MAESLRSKVIDSLLGAVVLPLLFASGESFREQVPYVEVLVKNWYHPFLMAPALLAMNYGSDYVASLFRGRKAERKKEER